MTLKDVEPPFCGEQDMSNTSFVFFKDSTGSLTRKITCSRVSMVKHSLKPFFRNWDKFTVHTTFEDMTITKHLLVRDPVLLA